MSLFELLFGGRRWTITQNVIITDVTRMEGDQVCIAALGARRGIRLHDPQPKEPWLRSIGGLAPGDVVSLMWKPPRSFSRPHVEDADWNPSALTKDGRLSQHDLIERLSVGAFDTFEKVFGKPCFYSDKGNAAFPPGRGSRSLATIVVKSTRAYPYGGGIRVDFSDSKRDWCMAPLEDLAVRKHQRQCKSCWSSLPDLLLSEFQGSGAILRIGLGRSFQVAAGQPAACWMQVNHIFLIPSKRKHFV